MADDRLPCSVPGCRRTTGGPFTDWICGPHWTRLTKAERRVWARIKRLARRHGWDVVAERADRIWEALIRRATPPIEENAPHARPRHDPDRIRPDRTLVRTRRGAQPITRPRR